MTHGRPDYICEICGLMASPCNHMQEATIRELQAKLEYEQGLSALRREEAAEFLERAEKAAAKSERLCQSNIEWATNGRASAKKNGDLEAVNIALVAEIKRLNSQREICEGTVVEELNGEPVPGNIYDGTEAACPAYWRGQDNGSEGAMKRVVKLSADILELKADNERLRQWEVECLAALPSPSTDITDDGTSVRQIRIYLHWHHRPGIEQMHRYFELRRIVDSAIADKEAENKRLMDALKNVKAIEAAVAETF